MRNMPASALGSPDAKEWQFSAIATVASSHLTEVSGKSGAAHLLKPNDETVKLVKQGIDTIDAHVPEKFARANLERALGVNKG